MDGEIIDLDINEDTSEARGYDSVRRRRVPGMKVGQKRRKPGRRAMQKKRRAMVLRKQNPNVRNAKEYFGAKNNGI